MIIDSAGRVKCFVDMPVKIRIEQQKGEIGIDIELGKWFNGVDMSSYA